ncbi:MAG TPA: hypothetical protein ENJ52_15220 [Aliiroseovarius sp.]|nr:hypothetical protein [Aliiroseovarius sp.]
MKKLLENRTFLIFLILLTSAVSYLTFRYLYGVAGDFPFTQEILLVFIGAVATVLITAVLLNQQTELELRKEGQVLLLDQKSATYSALIEHIGEIVEKGRMDEAELAELKVLNHKLAMIASADVIHQFREVLKRLDEAMADDAITGSEQARIMRAVARLTYFMRHDLLGRIEGEDDREVLSDILANTDDLED